MLKKSTNKKEVEYLLNISLSLLKRIKHNDIINSKYINMNNIKELFLSAYRWTLTLNYTIEEQPTNIFSSYSDLEHNLVVKYLANYNNSTIENAFGRQFKVIVDDAKKDISIYQTIQEPKKYNASNNQLSNLLIDKYNNLSVKMVYSYISSGVYMESVIPNNSNVVKFYNDNKEVLELEKNITYEYLIANQIPFHNILAIKIKLNSKLMEYINKYTVAKCKCKNSTFLYITDTSGTIKELSVSEIRDWTENKNIAKLKEFKKYKYVATKCTCENTHKKSENIYIFYKYFEQYCPKGELHQWNSENNTANEKLGKKCIKCGISNEIILTMQDAYYNKWKDEYIKIQQFERKITENNINEMLNRTTKFKTSSKISDKTSSKKNEKNKTPLLWEMTQKSITNLTKQFKIKNLYNLFINIGLYEGREYSKLESNKIDPSLDSSDDDKINQIYKFHNYHLYLASQYYTIKNSEFIYKLPYDTKLILTKFKQSNREFNKKLGNLNDSYCSTYSAYFAQMTSGKLKIKDLVNFVSESLAQVILDIYSEFKNAKIENFGDKFCQYYIAKIISFEKVLCLTKLKNLKVLAKYRNNDDEGATAIEDHDMIESQTVEDEMQENNPDVEIQIDDQYDSLLSLEDVDIELSGEGDEDNLYNDDVSENMNLGLMGD